MQDFVLSSQVRMGSNLLCSPPIPDKFTTKAWDAIVEAQDRGAPLQASIHGSGACADCAARAGRRGWATPFSKRPSWLPSCCCKSWKPLPSARHGCGPPCRQQSVSGPKPGSHVRQGRGQSPDPGRQVHFVEHLLLGFAEDERIGRRLLRGFEVESAELMAAIQAVRGSQKVTDQNPESQYQALEKFGRDLTEQAREGGWIR
jgi:ATP-dependent Clp protease ATP-binding subunit ClpB